ncbi:MAG: MATE family efflux transporter [Lachnospiraceae bacterium]|nr:MATE family efflux transporter [Lachnospiraceae bacterium]
MQMRTMTEGTPWKHILRFSMPVMAGSLLQQLYNTADTIIVGRYAGEAALSAVGTTMSFAFFFLALAIGFSTGNGIVVAQHYGAQDTGEVRRTASTGILFLMSLGVISALVAVAVSGPAYEHLVKVPDDFRHLTLIYFRIYAVGLIFQFGYNILSSILRAVGDSAATLYFLLISSVLNIVLDLVFVAVFKWGVAGAAAATDISQAVSFAAAYVYMRSRYPVFRFALSEYHWNKDCVLKTMKVGFPISLQLVIVSVGFTFIQRAVNGFGRAMTAAFTVGQRIEMYLNMPSMAFQTTLATYTGQNIGAGRMDRIRIGVRQTYVISITMTLIISALIWLFAGSIVTAFGLSAQAASYALEYLKAMAFVNIIFSLYVPLFGVFQGANHSTFPLVIASSALTARVIVTYLFRYSAFLGYRIIWWNGVVGFGMGLIVTFAFYFSGRWQKNARVS